MDSIINTFVKTYFIIRYELSNDLVCKKAFIIGYFFFYINSLYLIKFVATLSTILFISNLNITKHEDNFNR